MSKLISFMLGTLFLVSCGEHTELEQPIVNNDGETVAVTKEIQIRVLPMQSGGASTRSASDKPEEGEAVTMTYHDAATSRTDMTAVESKINNAYILQFGGTSSGSVLKALKAISAAELSGSSAVTCTFAMTAGIKNRVYVVANLPSGKVPTLNTTTLGTFESAVVLPPSTELPSTGLPMSACQDIGVGDVLDIFQLRSTLAKLTFKTSAGTLKLKGLPNGYSFYSLEPGNAAVRTSGVAYSNSGVALASGTTYYVPENLSGRKEFIEKHIMRALGLAPVNSMYMEITNGSIVYNLLLGDGSTSDFNFAGGGIYNINAVLTGTDPSDWRVGDLVTPHAIDLNATGETANCYIATSAATWYIFRCDVMGNGATTLLPANMDVAKSVASRIVPHARLNSRSVDVLWETRNTATAPAKGDVVNNTLYLLKDRILFRTGATEGNAVIAARNASNDIIWSWHIWRTNTDPTAAPQTLSPFTAGSGTFDATGTATLSGLKILDRNLGALSATAGSDLSTGLYYQWGRKDPFPGSVALSGSSMIATTNIGNWNQEGVTMKKTTASLSVPVSNPTVFYATGGDWTFRNDNLWGTPLTSTVVINNGANNSFNSNHGSKSIYDPCPAGWRVPPGYAFANVSKGKGGTFSKGYSFGILTSGSSWFPASGDRCNSGGTLLHVAVYGLYWASSPNVSSPADGSLLGFNSSYVNSESYIDVRSNGNSVRCAQE